MRYVTNNMSLLPLKLAWQTLRQNKGRSGLTVFGILIGIALVIIVMSAGNGVQGIVLNEISSFGDNWINIEVKIPSADSQSRENMQAFSRGVSITTMRTSDARAIEGLDSITDLYAMVNTQAIVSYREEKKQPMIFGVSASYIDIDKSEIAEGEFFTDADDLGAAQVAVIGNEVRDVLFGNGNAVGETIKLDGKNYQVIGVMEERGSTGFFNMDELVYVPLRTVQRKIMGIDHILAMIAQLDEGADPEAAAEEIRFLMRERHDISDPDKDDFSVTTQTEAIETVGTIVVAMTMLLIVIAAISLIVGGVGIMNVMYVSVVERTFEIGLRKSVGATEKDILWQFLSEAVVITFIGGILGIALGGLVAFVVATGAQSQGLAWDFKISFSSVAIATGFSVAVGLVFGIYPAKKAAKLDPISALRAE